jgi:hypothetical protein
MVRVHITNGRLDRVRPGALRSYITNDDWIQLANDIDNALWPVLRLIRLQRTIVAIGFLCFLYGFILTATSMLDSDFYFGGWIICFVSIVVMILAMILLNIYRTYCLETQVKHSMENILQQFSDDNQGGLTAHLIPQDLMLVHGGGDGGGGVYHATTGNFILEISVDDQRHDRKERRSFSPSYHPLEEAQRDNTTSTPSSSIDIRQRLERLGQLRDALSNEEYQERRRIIVGEL